MAAAEFEDDVSESGEELAEADNEASKYDYMAFSTAFSEFQRLKEAGAFLKPFCAYKCKTDA